MASPKLSYRTLFIVGIMLAVVVVGAAFYGGLLSIGKISGANTQAQYGSDRGWQGGGNWADNQLLDAPQYVGGFYASANSEKIVASAHMSRPGIGCTTPGVYDYRFWFKSGSGTYPAGHVFNPSSAVVDGNGPVPTPGYGWVLIKEDGNSFGNVGGCSASVNPPPSLVTVTGNFIGVVRVEFWAGINDIGHDAARNYVLFGQDEATVQAGWGLLSIKNADSLVQVGESLVVHYDVGAACSQSTDPAGSTGCGWTVSLRNQVSGATPSGWSDKTLPDFVVGDISVPVTSSWFVLGQKNEYEVKLFNQVNLQDQHTVVTIDDKTLAPGTPALTSVSPGPPYHQGTVVTVTVGSSPNSVTKSPIQSYHITVRQGERVVKDQDSASPTVVFSVPDEQVDVHVSATAFDGNRTSGVLEHTIVVEDTDQNNNPPSGAGLPSIEIILILLVAGIAMVLLGIYLGFLPWWARAILIVVGLVLAIFGGYLLVMYIVQVIKNLLGSLSPF